MSGTAPAGWYPDPRSPSQIRFWSGSQWTDNVAPRVTQHTPAVQPMPEQDAGQNQQATADVAERNAMLRRQIVNAAATERQRTYATERRVAKQQVIDDAADAAQDIVDAKERRAAANAAGLGDDESMARTLLMTGGIAAGIGFLGALKNELESRTAARNAALEADEWDDDGEWDDEDETA